MLSVTVNEINATLPSNADEYCRRRSEVLNSIRVFGTDAASIGMDFMEPQTPLSERSPRRSPTRFALAANDAQQVQRQLEAEAAEAVMAAAEHEQLQWVRSVGFSGHPVTNATSGSDSAPTAYPPRYAGIDMQLFCDADGVPFPTLPTAATEYRFLLHQEATYRRFVIQQADIEFTLLFDTFFDGLQLLRQQLHEVVTRYWLLSDWETAQRSLELFAAERMRAIALKRAAVALEGEEDAARELLFDAFLSSLDAFGVEEAGDYLATMTRMRRDDDATAAAAALERTLPPPSPSPQALPKMPVPPTAASVEQPEAGERHPRHRHTQQRRILEQFVLGHPHRDGAKADAGSASPARDGAAAGGGDADSPQRYRVAAAARSQEALGALVMDFTTPVEVRQFVVDQEARVRARIAESYGEETTLLLRRVAQYSALAAVALRRFRIEVEEHVGRSNVAVEYFFMMLEACETLERVRRRDLIIKQQPRALAEFRYEEKQAWLRARKAESDRFTREELDAVEGDKQLREALTRWSETRLRQKLSLNRDETNARLALMHDESSQHSVLYAMFEDAMDGLREVQAAFELDAHIRATTVVWTKHTYDTVYLREAQHRTSVMADEKEAFGRLKAAETSCYLATRRGWLVDEVAREMMAPYDEFSEQLRMRLAATAAS